MDGELGERIRIQRLERRIANLELRVRDLEAEAGFEPALAAGFGDDELAQPLAPLTPFAPPPAPMQPVPDPVAAAWSNESTRRAYGIDQPATRPSSIPGWSATTETPTVAPQPAPAVGWGPGSLGTTPAEPSKPAFSFDLKDLEERFAGRALAWIGGAALIAAAVFFLSLAFSRGWIGEELRVVIGLVAGTAALVGGAVMFDRKTPLIGNVLVAVGLGIVSIALFAATRGYALVAPEFGLAGAFLAAVAAAVIAIRYDAKEVAAFGLLAALGAPPIMNASPNMLTLLFVAVTLVGTTAIALFRTWPYLPTLAFILAAPQLASYLGGGVGAVEGLIAVIGFWAVNVIAAAGEEWRIHRDQLKPTSATLVLANATFSLWGGSTVLTGANHADLVGTFIGLLSIAHLLLGGWFLYRQGLYHLFGNLIAGTGLALVAIAAFVQLGAPVVPLAWAAEATALAWLAVRRMHKWSALAALILGGLAVAHVLLVEYPLWNLQPRLAFPALPWLHADGASVLSVVAAVGLTAVLVPVRWIRSALVALAALLLEYAALFEVRGAPLAGTLVLIALAAVVLERVVSARGTKPSLASVGVWVPSFPFAGVAAAVAGSHAVLFVAGGEFPLQLAASGAVVAPPIPWLHPSGFSALFVLAGLGAGAALLPIRWIRSLLVAIAVVLAAYVSAFEVQGPWLTLSVTGLALAALLLERVISSRGTRAEYAAIGAWSATFPFTACAAVIAGVHATIFVITAEFPAWLFGSAPAMPYVVPATISLVVLLAGLVAAGRLLPERGVRSVLGGVGVLVVAWTLLTQFVALPLYASLAVLLPLAVALERGIRRLGDRSEGLPFTLAPAAGRAAPAAGALVWLISLWLAAFNFVPPILSGSHGLPTPPFTDLAAATAVALIGSAIAAARWSLSRQGRTALLIGSIAVAAGVVPLEVNADLIVPLWLLLAGAAIALTARRDDVHGALRDAARGLALILAVGSVLLAFGVVAPVERLWVQGGNGWTPRPLLPVWPLSLASVAAVLALASRRAMLGRRSVWLGIAAAATGVYLVSVGVVDVFQRQVGGAVAPEELSKQAQVAMSVAWTVIGVASLTWGLTKGFARARHIGLGLLGIATLKVFVVDLASMDVAYRAVVLAGLGVLLILAAGLFTRLRGPRSEGRGGPGVQPAG